MNLPNISAMVSCNDPHSAYHNNRDSRGNSKPDLKLLF